MLENEMKSRVEMQKITEWITSSVVVQAVLSILFGLLLAIWPRFTTVTLVYILAGCLAVFGIVSVISYLRNRKKVGGGQANLLIGLLSVIIAIVIVAAPQLVAGLFTLVFGAILILSGLFNAFRAIGLKSLGGIAWIFMLVIAALIIIGGIIVIVNPFETFLTFVLVLGLLLVVKGAADLVTYYYTAKISAASRR